eukprot:m.11482 g.11482  ORF g.11482 m.11482 type:complete len:163 (+) comp4445_c0_seq1:1632-2120(+)
MLARSTSVGGRWAGTVALAATSIRGSFYASEVVRGMQKKTGSKKPSAEPVEELDGSVASIKTLMIPPGPRPNPPLTKEDMNERAATVKAWARYSIRQEHEWNRAMARVARARSNALDELKFVNPTLYYAALEPDRTDWPLHMPAPTDTPPIENYSTTEAVKI